MRDLNAIMQECIAEMKAINIPVKDNEIKEIKANDINYLGICEDDRELKTYRIIVKDELLKEDCPLIVLKEVIIHELIHTCFRCMSHGKTFIKYAKMMDEHYGYHLLIAKDHNSIYHPEKPILHKFVCPKCGSIYNSREPRGNYWCIFCHIPYTQLF